MDKKKQNAAPLIVAGVLAILLIVCVVLLIVRVSGRVEDGMKTWQEQQEKLEKEPTKAPTVTPTATPTAEPTEAPTLIPTEAPISMAEEDYTLKRVNFEVALKLNDNAFIIWGNGKYSIANGEGIPVMDTRYPYIEYYDDEWVTFSDDNEKGYVYDTRGNLLYTYDLWVEGLFSEEGIEYGVWTCYKKGIKTELILGTEDTDYYGARYYNAETGELIFEAVGYYWDIAVNSIPDENGMAVVIQNGEREIVVHRITKDGYTTDARWYFDVEVRDFYYTDYANWTQNTMSEGWLLTTLGECENSTDTEYTDIVQALFDVNNFVIMPLPEEYQDVYADMYGASKGKYYGISTLTEEEYYGEYPETMYYAICYGNQKLTGEIYTWMSFEENYILAGNVTEGYAHILDYNGKVLKEYVDMGTSFVNGKLVVYDGKDAFLLDETLEACSGSLMSDVDFCGPSFVWKGRMGYMILEQE